MAEHSMIYSVSGATYENLAQMKAAGLIDFYQVVHAGAAPDPNFVKACNDLNVSPCFQNGNDGIAGCTGDCNAYYKRVADAGYHGAGGESEQNAEMHAIMNNLIFTNFGGEGLQPLSNIFANILPEGASGHGISSWLETYKSDVQLYPKEVVDSAIIAKKYGCKEVGFMIGWWMPVTAAPYIAMARSMEAQGQQCDGFNVWLGHGSSMWNNYQKWAGVFKELMAIWPPNMTPMKQRFSGVTPPPPPVNPMPFFKKGEDSALWKWDGSSWLSLGGVLTSQPAVVTRGAKAYDVFARGTDGGLWHLASSNKNWENLGGKVKSDSCIEAYSRDGTSIVVYVTGMDSAIWYRTWSDASGWSSWKQRK